MPTSNVTKKKQKHWKQILAAVLILLLLAIFVVPAAVLTAFLHHHVDYLGRESALTPLQGIHTGEMYELQKTVLTLTTEDGERLWCAEVPAEQPRGVIIYLSGITQPSVTYFFSHAAWLQEHEFAALLLEVRAHGNSTGNKIGLGYTEVTDVQAAVSYIKGQADYQDVPIIIWGVSMGGAIALNAFGQIEEIDGCIAMSPYASFQTEADLLMRQFWIPAPIRAIENALLEKLLVALYGRETVMQNTPEVQIQNANGRPVFLIACEEDTTVPVENARILHKRNPEATVWIRNSWEHFVIKDCDFASVTKDTEYCQRTLTWLNELVKKVNSI